MSAMEVETPPAPPGSTYQWFASNPLASSCGSTIYSAYEGSKNYSRLTKAAFGTMESALGYMAETAKPVVGKVAEKLDRPSKWLARVYFCFPSSYVCHVAQLLWLTRRSLVVSGSWRNATPS